MISDSCSLIECFPRVHIIACNEGAFFLQQELKNSKNNKNSENSKNDKKDKNSKKISLNLTYVVAVCLPVSEMGSATCQLPVP